MDPTPYHLLQPSLSGRGEAPQAAPYSQQAGFLTAFFGGPFALAIMFAINSKRLSRLGRDAGWIALAALGYAAWVWFCHRTSAGQEVRAWLLHELGRRGPEIAERLIALAGYALMALCHRREQRSATLFGLDRPNGLWLGLGLIVAGNVLSIALVSMLSAGRP